MFGYVVPDKPDLRVREWDQYRAVYCSLCYALKQYGFGAKMMLNYDFVFSVMLHLSLQETAPVFFAGRCNTNPLQKEQLMQPVPELAYSAAALILSVHYKLADDQKDERLPRRFTAFWASLFTRRAYKNTKKAYPDVDVFIAKKMSEQALIEQQKTDSVDLACDATAQGLAFIFENMSKEDSQRRILWRLGYLTGRFAYLADATDDLADDLKKNRYNVYIQKYMLKKEDDLSSCIEEAKSQLRLTAAEIELAYRLLEPQHFGPILDNIIYRGLLSTIERVGLPRKGKKR